MCPGLACNWEMPEMNEETGAGDGLEPAINPAISITISARVRLQARTGSTNGVRSRGSVGKTGRAASSGHPVFGSVAATTPKHSVVALVWVAGANTPMAAASGAYSLRQQ